MAAVAAIGPWRLTGRPGNERAGRSRRSWPVGRGCGRWSRTSWSCVGRRSRSPGGCAPAWSSPISVARSTCPAEIHDAYVCRRSCTRTSARLVQAGVELAVVQQLLGPASITMQLYGDCCIERSPVILTEGSSVKRATGPAGRASPEPWGRLRAPLRRLVGLPRIYGPAVPGRVPQRAGGVAEQRVEPLHPPVHVMWLTSAPRSASGSSTSR